MRLLVYMRDGRTVFRISGRGELARLVKGEPFHEDRGVLCGKGIWNPETGDYVWQQGIRVRFLAKGSISHVEQESPATGEQS